MKVFLANNSLVQTLQDGRRFFTAYGPSGTIPELPNIKFEFGDGTAQGIAVHAQFTRGFALVAFVLLKNVHNEALLEFTNRFRVEDAARVHLRHECFKLVLHRSLTFA